MYVCKSAGVQLLLFSRVSPTGHMLLGPHFRKQKSFFDQSSMENPTCHGSCNTYALVLRRMVHHRPTS